jgi:hypothetical protein
MRQGQRLSFTRLPEHRHLSPQEAEARGLCQLFWREYFAREADGDFRPVYSPRQGRGSASGDRGVELPRAVWECSLRQRVASVLMGVDGPLTAAAICACLYHEPTPLRRRRIQVILSRYPEFCHAGPVGTGYRLVGAEQGDDDGDEA